MKSLIRLVILFILISGILKSQNSAKPEQKPIPRPDKFGIYTIVDEMPSFPGKEGALNKYLKANLKYPKAAKEEKIQGKVYVSFIVNDNGKVADVKIIKGIGGGCDEEAKRVMFEMPKWKPGKQNGKNVRVQYKLPIEFKLDEGVPNNNEKSNK